MGENIFLNHCHAMEFTCISTVGTRGVFSTFQVTCNTSTDHKNKNLRSSLLSTVEQKKKRKKKGGTYTDSLPRCLRFFLLFIYINTSLLYIYIFSNPFLSLKKVKRSLRFQTKRKAPSFCSGNVGGFEFRAVLLRRREIG